MADRTLRSGEVAQEAGINVETLRYYERRGILKEPERKPSGYRVYTVETVRVVRFEAELDAAIKRELAKRKGARE